MITIGTSGFDYDDWRGFFYPDKLAKSRFLQYYAEHFDALELNFSYYRMPTPAQTESMVQRTEGKVEFAVKAHRSMTHERTAIQGELDQFIESLAPMKEAGKLGAVLAQFPHSFKQTEENRFYLKRLADQLGPPLVAELRDSGWAQDPIIDWFGKIGVGYCCVDEPQIEGLMPPKAAAPARPAYVRFHGRNAAKWYNHDQAYERYDYKYSGRELAEWVPKIRDLEKKAGKVMVFFNNHFQGKAVDGAKNLARLLSQPRKSFAQGQEKSLVKRALKGVLLILLAAFVLQLAYLLSLKWIDPPLTLTQFGGVLDGYTFKRDYVELEEISPWLRLAVIAAEDQKFPTHNGFDWESIEKAVEHNSKGGGSLRGASTISQQTAKNVFLWQGRTWLRKGLETYLTVMLEHTWSKRRILEVYLNVAEMGPGVFGAQAAAKHYYGADAKDLNSKQAATIAAFLPNPKTAKVKNIGVKYQRKVSWIQAQMKILKQNNNIKPLLTD